MTAQEQKQVRASLFAKLDACRQEKRDAERLRADGKLGHRGWCIYPSQRTGTYDYAHDGYDGPGDNRCGNEPTIAACRERIDERIEESNG